METAAALPIVPPVPRSEHPSSTIDKKERSWKEFIEDTAQCNDLRHSKVRPGKPDHERRLTRDFVWVNGSNNRKPLKPLGHHVRNVQGPPGRQETLLDQDGLEKVNVDSGDLWCDSLCLDEVMARLDGNGMVAGTVDVFNGRGIINILKYKEETLDEWMSFEK